MNKDTEVEVPYSAQAVKDLLGIENIHIKFNSLNGLGWSWCKACFPHKASFGLNNTKGRELLRAPCPDLVEARNKVSRETIIAVALILNGANK